MTAMRCYKFGQSLGFGVRKARFDDDVLPFDIAQPAHALYERRVPVRGQPGLARTEIQKAHARHLPHRLRLDGRQASEEGQSERHRERESLTQYHFSPSDLGPRSSS